MIDVMINMMVAMIIFARGVFQILMTAGLLPSLLLFFSSNIHLFLSPPILISVALTIAIMVKSTRIQSLQLFRNPKFLLCLPLTTPTTLPSSVQRPNNQLFDFSYF